MTALAEPLATPASVDEDPRIVHRVCQVHEDDAFCGLRLPDEPWAADTETVTCPLCALAEEQGVVCVHPGCPGWRKPGGRRFLDWLRGASS